METMYPDPQPESDVPARIGRGRAMPPSKVLFVRSNDTPEEHLQQELVPIARSEEPDIVELPMFQQVDKGHSFIQFPSIDCARRAMDLINNGEVRAMSGSTMHAEFSSRPEVVSRKRPQPCQYEQESKRFQSFRPFEPYGRYRPPQPSPVLCLRSDMSENDLRTLLDRSFNLLSILVVHRKNMIFAEFASIEDSTNGMNFLLDRGIDVAYSNRTRIDYRERMRSELPMRPNDHFSQQNLNGEPLSDQRGPMREMREMPPSCVVVVHLKALQETSPPSVDNLLTPFSHCGIVEKIIVFSHEYDSGDCEAWIQYATTSFARLSIDRYDAQTLGAYRLHVNFSDRDDININQNSDTARDFTNPWLTEY